MARFFMAAGVESLRRKSGNADGPYDYPIDHPETQNYQHNGDLMAIFTHVTVGTNNLAKARSFYDAVLATLGYKRLTDLGDSGSIWGKRRLNFSS